MSAGSTTLTLPPRRAQGIPPLQPGDKLTRAEFERRYDATPNLKKAELIEGVVYMPPPVAQEGHSSEHFDIITILGIYRIATPGIEGGDNGSLRLDLDNMPQPDAYLVIRTDLWGQSRIVSGGYVQGAPELVAEVAASSVSYDLHQKLNVYRRNGIQEYIVWRVYDAQIDWFTLKEGRYDGLTPGGDGIYRSVVFPGLWLAPTAMVNRNVAQVSSALQQGIASPEHGRFVERLKRAAPKP
jgi:Uma2 family endonuclease